MIEKYYNRAVTSLFGTARVQGLYDMEKLSTFWETLRKIAHLLNELQKFLVKLLLS